MEQKLISLPNFRFVTPEGNRKKFDLGLEEDENLLKLRQITKKQAFAHQRHQKIDAFERLVFEDFNSPLYASKSTISMNNWSSLCNWQVLKQKFEYIDPRGYINMSWLFLLGICYVECPHAIHMNRDIKIYLVD